MLNETLGAAKPVGDLVKNATDASFMTDVVEASKTQPVIVDFWAPWCGPCRQLTPVIERAVNDAKGAVRLVKINIDENPQIAGQLRVQSIPAVFAFKNGQPVDGFMGALPESQIKAFIGRLIGATGPSEVDALLAEAAEALTLGDNGGAAQAFAEALQLDPENVKAIAGLARCYLNSGDTERAQEVADMAPADATDAELSGVRAALALSAEGSAETAGLERQLAADPGNHEARLEYAKALAGQGNFQGAVDQLMLILEKELDWNEGAARKQLLTVFEAAGPTSDVTKTGRRRLSSLLFS